jgi:hypothetical protein
MKKKIKAKTSKKIVIAGKELALTPEYRETVKFTRWCQHFLDKSSKTYGNATQSALQVYNTENVHSAGNIGNANVKKLENLGVVIADIEGFGYADLMKILIGKVIKGSYDDAERFMVRLGYFEDKPNSPVAVQFNFNNLGEAINKDREARGLKPL